MLVAIAIGDRAKHDDARGDRDKNRATHHSKLTMMLLMLAAMAIRTTRSATPPPTTGPTFSRTTPTSDTTLVPTTLAPSSATTTPNATRWLEAEGVCFSDGCEVTESFHLTDGLEELVAASLSVEWKGDVGSSSETADLYVNDHFRLTCPSPGVGDCPFAFQRCATEIDVLPELTAGGPLVVRMDAAGSVNDICDDADLVDYAMRVRFVLTFECTYGASPTGCFGTTQPTTSPAPTALPSLAPTALPSVEPTTPPPPSPLPTTPAPSPSPTTPSPTTTPAPSMDAFCIERRATSTFASIAGEVGVELLGVSSCDDCISRVTLPFVLPWVASATGLQEIIVSSNGQLNLDSSTDNACCDADPIVGFGNGDRIAFAKEDLNPGAIADAMIYYLEKSTSSVVSFEGVPFHFARGLIDAQVELYDDGDVEIRWGDGTVPSTVRFAAGIESAVAGLAFPVTSVTSGIFDGTLPGVSVPGLWPSNDGVRFNCRYTPAPTTTPTALPSPLPTTTLAPTRRGGVSFPSFTTNPCDDLLWTCLDPTRVAVGTGDTLGVSGNGNYIRLVGEVFSSTRDFAGQFRITKDQFCDDHFVYLSTSPTMGWSWATSFGTIRFVWNCDILFIYGPTRTVSASCATYDTYDVAFDVGPSSSSLSAVGITSGAVCSVVLAEGFTAVAPSSEDVYFHFGADQDDTSGAAVWHSLFANSRSAAPTTAPAISAQPTTSPSPTALPSPAPTALPIASLPTAPAPSPSPTTSAPTTTFIPTRSGGVRIASFTTNPCEDPLWTCVDPTRVTVGTGDTLAISGHSNYIRLVGQVFSTTHAFAGQFRITKDQLCDGHFVYLSTSPSMGWSWASAFGTIRFVWNCDNLYIYGPTAAVSTSCASYDTYDVVFDVGSSRSSVSAVGSNSGVVCSAALAEGFTTVAPSGEDVYFHFGADLDEPGEAVWHSLFANSRSAAPTTAPTALPSALPTLTLAPTLSCFAVLLEDSFGDGWNGGFYKISTPEGVVIATGTLASGFSGVDRVCVAAGCYQWAITPGDWPGEISWTLRGSARTLSGFWDDQVEFYFTAADEIVEGVCTNAPTTLPTPSPSSLVPNPTGENTRGPTTA